jgi:hypothetical protein
MECLRLRWCERERDDAHCRQVCRALGLKELGYNYVGMDACWMAKGKRDPKTQQPGWST